MRNIKVLITGAGAPGAPGIIKSLKMNNEREICIVGVDINPKASGCSMVDEFYVVPKASDKNFIKEIMNICKIEDIDVVIPLVTKELFKFADCKQEFENKGIKTCVLDRDKLYIANDKGKLLDYLSQKKIPVPKYYIVDNLNSFNMAAKKMDYNNNVICFKPTISNGSRGFRIIDPKIDKANLLFNEKPNNLYMTYNEITEILSNTKSMTQLLLMEYLPGEEYSIDILADNGEMLYCIPRRRDKIIGGISVEGEIINDYDINDYCSSIVKELKLNGNIGIQVKRDINNFPLILEINPRVQGSIVFCTGAGVNLVYYGVKLALGEEIPKVDINWNIHMVRYWEEVYYDDNGYAFTL